MCPWDLQLDLKMAAISALLRQPVTDGVVALTHATPIGARHGMNARIIQGLAADVPHLVDLLT
eukprot:2241250-Prorocentrum_lima.AAC.1